MSQVWEVFTDGGCSPNPGPGGWGFVVVVGDEAIAEACGREQATTNNRMELLAMIRALEFCRDRSRDWDAATLSSDSNLCVQTYNSWMSGWQKRGWKRKTGPVENLDLVKQLAALKQDCPKIAVAWVKAHAGLKWNEYADRLTHQGRDRR